MANGTIHNIGTLYVNNIKRILPTKPWATNAIPPGASTMGNILDHSVETGNIEIRDTDVDSLYKLKFVEVRDRGKVLLISDRCLVSNISWDTLNSQNLVHGKEITIDGQKYKLRMLTGGTTWRGTDAYSGGTPITNEWDRIIVNEGGFIGLPTPVSTDLNSSQETMDISGVHNQFWNWVDMYTHVQEINTTNSSSRNSRGYIAAQTFAYSYSHVKATSTGWRPVLELMNDTVISDADGDLGDFVTPVIKQYSVTDSNYINLTVVEKINETILRTFACQSSEILTLDLSSIWDSLHLDTNTIKIEVTDDWGSVSTRTWTFTKVANPLPDSSSLRELIDRTELLASEVSYHKLTLKNNLLSKGVEVTDEDKLSTLVNKVKDTEESHFPQWTRNYDSLSISYIPREGNIFFNNWIQHENTILCIGDGNNYGKLCIYDCETNTYINKSNAVGSISQQRSCIIGNYLYYLYSSSFVKYSLLTDTHEVITSAPGFGSMSNIGRGQNSIIFKDGDGSGGCIYNPVTSTYEYLSSITTATAWYGSVVTIDNKVYVCFSIRNNNNIFVEEFNMDTKTSKRLGYFDALESVGDMRVFYDENNIYMYLQPSSTINKLLKYNIKDNKFIKYDIRDTNISKNTFIINNHTMQASSLKYNMLMYQKSIFN